MSFPDLRKLTSAIATPLKLMEFMGVRAANLLATQPAREFLDSLIFWDGKRPVTIEVLRALSLDAVAAVISNVQ